MNAAKLSDEMKKKHITRKQMCNILQISRSAFWRKCNGISEFTLSEIKKIIDILGIEDPMPIFFNQ